MMTVQRSKPNSTLIKEACSCTGGANSGWPPRRPWSLLTDLAHNLLAWNRGRLFRHSPFANAGIYRIVKELFPIPGEAWLKRGRSSSCG